MSPPRRRSARLASSTPKPKASLSLDSLAEHDESPSKLAPQRPDSTLKSPAPVPTTPKSSAIKPPHEEMHPSHVHRSTAVEPSSGLRLGFTDIKNPNSPRVAAQMTPSRTNNPPTAAQFDFQFSRQAAAESQLSDEAQRMMDELREKASRFKAELVAQREAEGNNGERKIAKPRGKSGRFSAAHMAEFKKMDSIEGHASAWRAQDGRFTPVVQELKRSPSKNSIESTLASEKRGLKRSPSKANLDATTVTPSKPSLKRTSSKANLDEPQLSTPAKGTPLGLTPRKIAQPSSGLPQPMSAAKRFKKREQDDATSSRPASRDGSSLPRPKSSGVDTSVGLSRLLSPTKASAAHTASPGKSTITLVKSTSANSLRSITQSPSAMVASPSRAAELKRRIISPGRLQRVTSLLRRNKGDSDTTNTAIPAPSVQASQTPNPPRLEKALPPVPLTTPRRKLTKHVSFTPETFGKKTGGGSETPSPKKTVPRFGSWRNKGSDQFPALDGILKKSTSDDVSYPNLSKFKSPLGNVKQSVETEEAQATPGRFTFRSDHTIQFGGTPAKGFGASAGQSSVRQVRGSLMPTVKMPGGFPEPSSPISHPNKENKEPEAPLVKVTGVPHGMSNKKRHRPTWDEEEAEEEAAERATKKRKGNHVPAGQAVVAPRMAVATPTRSVKKLPGSRSVSRTPGTPSPVKRSGGGGLSLSRLNMLARPKNRA